MVLVVELWLEPIFGGCFGSRFFGWNRLLGGSHVLKGLELCFAGSGFFANSSSGESLPK